MIKGSIQEEDVTLTNVDALHKGVPKRIEQILTDKKGEIDRNKIIRLTPYLHQWTDLLDRKSIKQQRA